MKIVQRIKLPECMLSELCNDLQRITYECGKKETKPKKKNILLPY